MYHPTTRVLAVLELLQTHGRLSAAAKQGLRVQLHYRAGGQQSERDFDTYGLAYYGGYWYAVGYCHLRRAMRTFRLDRMGPVRQLERTFTRPAHFDALVHLRDSVAAMPRKFSATVLLKADLDTARRYLMDTI